MSREDERPLSTADFARNGEAQSRDFEEPQARRLDPAMASQLEAGRAATPQAEPLAALFQGPAADDFRRRWDEIQIGFVDDPQAAVRNADELVAQVLRSLAESFAEQRARIDTGGDDRLQADTENMRIALQRYRSFFQRLLSL